MIKLWQYFGYFLPPQKSRRNYWQPPEMVINWTSKSCRTFKLYCSLPANIISHKFPHKLQWMGKFNWYRCAIKSYCYSSHNFALKKFFVILCYIYVLPSRSSVGGGSTFPLFRDGEGFMLVCGFRLIFFRPLWITDISILIYIKTIFLYSQCFICYSSEYEEGWLCFSCLSNSNVILFVKFPFFTILK